MKALLKKLSLTLLLVCTALSFTCFFACGIEHVHTYEETVAEKYLKTAATCQTKAVYYKSCSCGKASDTETFEGSFGDHSYENRVCSVCGKKQPSDGLSFELNTSKNEYSVAGVGTCTDTDLVIPETYNGLSVTGIENYAFKDCTALTSITLTDDIKNIGYYAFDGCSSINYNECDNACYLGSETNDYFWLIKAKSTDITSCVINENCKHIYSFAFENCTALTEIKFNAIECANLSRVVNNAKNEEKNNAFHNAGTDGAGITVTIGKNVKVIPENLFFGVSSIKEVVFEDDCVCETIGSYAFNHCASLATVRMSDSVKYIEYAAFDYCTLLENIYYSGDVNEWSETEGLDNLMCYSTSAKKLYIKGELLTNAEIATATKINGSAFNNCGSLTSITIGDTVTSIGDNAFKNCASLKIVKIGKKISSLGNDVFFGCPIEKADVPSIAISSVNNSKLTTLSVTSGASISEGVLSGCTTLTDLTIGDTVTDIGNTALGDCKVLESIKVEEKDEKKNEKYKSIDGNLYSKDGKTLVKYAIGKSATEFTIDGDVTNIGDYAFYNCANLTKITIGNNVTSVGDYAFKGCGSLIYYEDDNAYYLGNEENKYLCLIKTKSTEITSYTVNENCKFIYSSAFENCGKLTSITIGSGVTGIGDSAFKGCSSVKYNEADNAYYLGNEENKFLWLIKAKSTDITSCSVNENCKFIYSSAFENCDKLTSITIGNKVASIGDSAFKGCSSLKYNEDDNAYYLGNEENKFLWLIKAKSTDITSCSVNENCKFIYGSAFENCDKLESVTIGSKVIIIGEGAFNKCDKLTVVYYKASESDWLKVVVSKDNEKLTNAKIYCYSESEPTGDGNYWHIVDGKPAAWKK